MEYVWLTTGQRNAIADCDTQLSKYFVRALACDELPETPERFKPRANAINTDPADKPGQHWLGVWTENDTCELLDSHASSLSTYEFIYLLLIGVEPMILCTQKRQIITIGEDGKLRGLRPRLSVV